MLVRERLRQLIDDKQISQAALAEKADLGAAVLSRILTGDREIHFEHVLALARALEVTVPELLSGTDGEAMLREWIPAATFADETNLRAQAQAKAAELQVELTARNAELASVRKHLEEATARAERSAEDLVHLRAERDRLKSLTAELAPLRAKLLEASTRADGAVATADELRRQLGGVAAELLKLRSAHRTAVAQVQTLQNQLQANANNTAAAGAIGALVGGIVVALANDGDDA